MFTARPNDNHPIPVAKPDDTTFSYMLRVLDWIYQAGVRREDVTDQEWRYRASVVAEQMRKLTQNP